MKIWGSLPQALRDGIMSMAKDASIALTFPLIFLYELGIFLARPAKEEVAAAG
jgi:hypothetical protein